MNAPLTAPAPASPRSTGSPPSVPRGAATHRLRRGDDVAGCRCRGPVLRTSLSGVRLFLWLHPHDPLLPDLPWALHRRKSARQLFGSADGRQREPVGHRLPAPAARGRTCCEWAGRGVRQGGAARPRGRPAPPAPAARSIRQSLPPPCWPERKAAAPSSSPPLPGEPLLHGLADGSSPITPRTSPVLDALPGGGPGPEPTPGLGRACAGLRTGRCRCPSGRQPRITGISAGIESMVAALDPGPVVPVHGDFYEGNLLTADGRITGVLDVDGLGPGHRVDDLACFLGHLAVLARLSPESALPAKLNGIPGRLRSRCRAGRQFRSSTERACGRSGTQPGPRCPGRAEAGPAVQRRAAACRSGRTPGACQTWPGRLIRASRSAK